MVYFLTVNYYSANLLKTLINSLEENLPRENYQIMIVNNSPGDQELLSLNNSSIILLESPTNLGFGNACNLGLNWIYQQDSKALVWLINPDTILNKINLEQLESFFNNYPELSILGTIIYHPDQTIWFGGGKFNRNFGDIQETNVFTENTDQDYFECDWVSGCSMIINLGKFSNCPEFDPAYFLYYEDFDFCQRYLQEGHKIAITNQFSVIHQPSSITNRNITDKMFHSTYSYLLTLKKYTNLFSFMLKLIKLLINTIVLTLFKPSLAWGKFRGIYYFFYPSLNFRSFQKFGSLSEKSKTINY